MPGAPGASANAVEPERASLVLPSTIGVGGRAATPAWVVKAEEDLREAAARECMEALQRHLRTRNTWLDFERQHVRGVRGCTRMNDNLASVYEKIRAAAAGYRRHRQALLVLRGDGAWARELRKLRQEDIRGINERAYRENELAERDRAAELAEVLRGPQDAVPQDAAADDLGGVLLGRAPVQVGEGRRALSWIWLNTAALDGDALADSTPMVEGAAFCHALRSHTDLL